MLVRFLLTLIMLCGFGCEALSQTPGKVDTSTIQPGVQVITNYVSNPSARVNKTYGMNPTLNATLTRETGTGYKYDGIASFGCDTSANGGYCEWALDPISDQDLAAGRNCWARVDYKGDGTLYSLQVVDQYTSSQTLLNVTDWTSAYVPTDCSIPSGYSRSIRVTQTTAGTSPKLYIAGVTYGRSSGFGQVRPDDNTLTATIALGNTCAITNQGPISWLSITSYVGNGDCTLAFTNSVFGSDTPICTIGAQVSVPQPAYSATGWIYSLSNTSIRLLATYATTGSSNISSASSVIMLSCTRTGANYKKPLDVQSVDTASKPPNVIRYTSGSGTYTPSAGTKYIRVRMVGGGGGGGGSGTGSYTAAGAGGTTTFGTSLLTANGGVAGTQSGGSLGGTASCGSVLPCSPSQGSPGGGAQYNGTTTAYMSGGTGGGTPFGGGSSGGSYNTVGGIGVSGTGSGGGGAGGGATAGTYSGGGGASGGYVDATIFNPLGSYSYSVGAGGTAGGAGTGGNNGGAGGSGLIEITEYFQTNGVVSLQKGMVVSSSTGKERHERALINNNGTSCLTVNSSGSWFTAARTAAGKCTFTLNGFAQQPTCHCTGIVSGVGGCQIDNGVTLSNTSVGFLTNAAGTASDQAFMVTCDGLSN